MINSLILRWRKLLLINARKRANIYNARAYVIQNDIKYLEKRLENLEQKNVKSKMEVVENLKLFLNTSFEEANIYIENIQTTQRSRYKTAICEELTDLNFRYKEAKAKSDLWSSRVQILENKISKTCKK